MVVMVLCRYNPENIETLEQYVQFQVCNLKCTYILFIL